MTIPVILGAIGIVGLLYYLLSDRREEQFAYSPAIIECTCSPRNQEHSYSRPHASSIQDQHAEWRTLGFYSYQHYVAYLALERDYYRTRNLTTQNVLSQNASPVRPQATGSLEITTESRVNSVRPNGNRPQQSGIVSDSSQPQHPSTSYNSRVMQNQITPIDRNTNQQNPNDRDHFEPTALSKSQIRNRRRRIKKKAQMQNNQQTQHILPGPSRQLNETNTNKHNEASQNQFKGRQTCRRRNTPSVERPCCSICLETVEVSRSITYRCNHMFHRSCAADWLRQSSNCPNCRSTIRSPL